MKSFFNSIPLSIYSRDYYKTILAEASLKRALLRMLGIAALVSIVPMVAAFFSVFAVLSTDSIDKISSYVPADLDVEVRNGSVISHGANPYAIPNPNKETDEPGNLIVVDTTKAFSIAGFDAHDAYLVIGPDYIAVKTDAKMEVIQTDQVPNFRLNAATIEATLLSVAEYRGLIALGLSLIAYIVSFSGLYVGYGLWALLVAVLVLLGAKIWGLNLSYKQSYIVTLHAATLGMILDGLSAFVTVTFPLFSTLLTVIIAAYCLPKDNKEAKGTDVIAI